LASNVAAACDEATTTAAAPSLSIDALPAVTPPVSQNAGLSLASLSMFVSARTPSSRATIFGAEIILVPLHFG
jgi:hypothetical protein